MNTHQHDLFWKLYNDDARPRLEAACRSLSRSLTDNTMDADEMMAWVDDRMWKMLLKDQAPTFHDNPTPEKAVQRLARNAGVIARWSYLALCRKHWRLQARKRQHLAGMSRIEKLSSMPGADQYEHDEQVQHDLATLREKIKPRVRAQLAASWPEQSEKQRIALALGATSASDDELIKRTDEKTMNLNTIQQMRSRARKQAQAAVQKVLTPAAKLSTLGMIVLVAASFVLVSPVIAKGGEQTGGRGGKGNLSTQNLATPQLLATNTSRAGGGEQTGGGRGGV